MKKFLAIILGLAVVSGAYAQSYTMYSKADEKSQKLGQIDDQNPQYQAIFSKKGWVEVVNNANGQVGWVKQKPKFKKSITSQNDPVANMLVDFQKQQQMLDQHFDSVVSNIDNNEISIQKTHDSKNTYVSGNLEWHRKISTKHAFSSSFSFIDDKMNSEAFWDTNKPISEGLIPYEPQEFYMLNLLRQVQKKNLSGIFKHYWTTKNFDLIHVGLGNQYKEHHFFECWQ